MIKTSYSLIPEMQIRMEMDNDIGGNSQRTRIKLQAPAQPFEVDGEEKEIIEFTVVGNRELSELISGLELCKNACYKQLELQLDCTHLIDKTK